MMKPWRPLACAAALNVTIGGGVAMAQTLIVRGAPPGSTVEFVLNSTTIGSATVNPDGDATVAAARTADLVKTDIDVHIYVDVCDRVRRVLVVDRGLPPPPAAEGCTRSQIPGLFLARRVSTFVVNVGGSYPTVLLRQGRFSIEPPRAARTWSSSPTGLVLFGGGGFGTFRDMVALACGNVTQCAGDDSGLAYTAGASYWFTRYLAAEGSYLKPAESTAEGSESHFRFNSFLDAHVVTVAGKVGVPAGPVRLYGHAGANYHRATSGTTQTIEDVTVTTGDVTEIVEGGTQTYRLKTAGWGWLFGGGIEMWVTSRLGIYADAGLATLKGKALDDVDGAMNERLTFVLIGARLRIGP